MDAAPAGSTAAGRAPRSFPAPLVVRTPGGSDLPSALRELAERLAAVEAAVTRLEQRQDALLAGLADDGRRLVDEAVSEIRSLLFGE